MPDSNPVYKILPLAVSLILKCTDSLSCIYGDGEVPSYDNLCSWKWDVSINSSLNTFFLKSLKFTLCWKDLIYAFIVYSLDTYLSIFLWVPKTFVSFHIPVVCISVVMFDKASVKSG